jgi:hypothetical protein
MRPNESSKSSLFPLKRFDITELCVFFLPLLFAIGFYWLRSQHRSFYYVFVQEDGIAEDFQALLLLGAAILSGLTAKVLFSVKQRFLTAVFVLLTIGIFLVFGEEVSWGQRIFGWQSEGYFAANNFQHETNLHNDAHIRFFLDPAVLAVSTFAALASFLHLSFINRKAYVLSFFATELPTIGFFLICSGIYAVYLYLNPVIRPYYHGFDVFFWQDLEMAETFFAVGVFCTLLLKYRGAKQLFGYQRRTRTIEQPQSHPTPVVAT